MVVIGMFGIAYLVYCFTVGVWKLLPTLIAIVTTLTVIGWVIDYWMFILPTIIILGVFYYIGNKDDTKKGE